MQNQSRGYRGVAALLACFVALAAVGADAPKAKPAPAVAKAPAEVQFERTGGEKAIKVKKGTEFVVALPGNPTTGYRWLLKTSSDPAVVRLLGDARFTPDNPERAGSAGTERFTLKAMSAGTTELEWGYQRPWEKEQPAVRKAKLTIRVP